MSQFVETRWTRYGHDRVYIRTADGVDCGHVDLKLRTVVPEHAEYESVLRDSLARWSADFGDGAPAESLSEQGTNPPTAESPEHAVDPSVDIANTTEASTDVGATRSAEPSDGQPGDLVMNPAGAAARARRNEVNAQAPVMNFVARVLGVTTEERSWRVGAKGEEKVAAQLTRLGQGWHRIHAVPIGDRGSDIDHVVLGPPGVFTLNSKRHPRGRAWIGAHAVMVNGQRTDYLRNSRFEASRASTLLSSACGFHVAVKPVIVFVDLEDITFKQMPSDVQVVTRMRLVRWLQSQPAVLDPAGVERILAAARQRTTWGAPRPPI